MSPAYLSMIVCSTVVTILASFEAEGFDADSLYASSYQLVVYVHAS